MKFGGEVELCEVFDNCGLGLGYCLRVTLRTINQTKSCTASRSSNGAIQYCAKVLSFHSCLGILLTKKK